MAYDLALNRNMHDIQLVNGDFLVIDNKERVAQQLKITLWEWVGEWFLDARDGVPYQEYILVKNPNLSHIRQILTDKIMSVEGVTRINTLDLKYNQKSRNLIVDFVISTPYGQIVRTEVLNG